MQLKAILPFIAAAIMFVFTAYVLQRYVTRRKSYYLFWGIGLAMFGMGSFAGAYLALAWNRWVFYTWYLCGAVLTAAWIGHGTLQLLVRKSWAQAVTVLLVALSLAAALLLYETMPQLDESGYAAGRPISEQYGTKRLEPGEGAPPGVTTRVVVYRGEEASVIPGILPLGAAIRLTTPFFNIYGLLTLVGGAIWSSYLFWRKRVMPNRVVGNLMIATGALSIAFASTLTRLGYGSLLYVGELVAAVLMFSGFLAAAAREEAPQPQEPARRPQQPEVRSI